MPSDNIPVIATNIGCGLDTEQLDAGLRILDDGLVDVSAFWDQNITDFRQTLLSAISQTSDALLSPTIALNGRIELESQLESLVQYVEIADRYIARRSLSFARSARELPLSPWRVRWLNHH